MNRRIVFSNELKNKLDNVNYNENEIWATNEIYNTSSLMNKIVNILNEKYLKLNICCYEFRENVSVYNESSTYFGVIENENKFIEGYMFVIPPHYETRSGVLSQQVFPVMSGIMSNHKNSKDNKITNKPIFIINANDVNQTPSMVVNVLSGKILEFRYIDIFDRDIDEILIQKNMNPQIRSIEEYNKWFFQLSNTNEYFELDKEKKVLFILPTKLKDGIHINNEPYWFALRVYAAIYLAVNEDYKIDMSKFDEILPRGNKTLDAFRDYAERFK